MAADAPRDAVRAEESFVSRALRLGNELRGMDVVEIVEPPVDPEPRDHRSAWRREPLVKTNLRPGSASSASRRSGAGAMTLKSMSCT